MKFLLAFITMLIAEPVLAACPSPEPAGTACVEYGSTRDVSPGFSACRRVWNGNGTGQAILVPTGDPTAWNLFFGAMPPGVNAGSCMVCSPGQQQYCGSIPNGYGIKYCSGDGMSWGGCQYYCNDGYEMRNGSCQLPMMCSPYSTQYCAGMANATCSQSCNPDGMSWGACGSCTCDPGYEWRDGSCQVPPPTYQWQPNGGCYSDDSSIQNVNPGDLCSAPGSCTLNYYKQALRCQ